MANGRQAARGLGRGEHLRERDARSSVNFGRTNPDSSRTDAPSRRTRSRDLLGSRTRTNSSGDPSVSRPSGEVGELPDQVLLGAHDLGVDDRVLQAQDHGDHAASRACLTTSSARWGLVAGLYRVAPRAAASTRAGESAVKTHGSRWKRRSALSGAICPK